MTQHKKSQNMGLLMIVVFSAVFLWALTAVVWPVPVVYADGPEILTITVTSNLETYFYDPGLDPTGGTVYFNSLAGEGAGQVLTVTATCSGTVTYFEGAPAFDDTPAPDTSAPWEITYTVEIGAETQNGIVFTVTNALSQTDTAVITFTQDITDPTILSPTINEDSDYLYADALTLYYSDLMSTPQSFTVQGNATDDGGAGLDQATFSPAFGVTPPADGDPANWSGTYDDVESGDNGDGTLTVTVTDNVGNGSEQTFDYIEDTTDPTVSLTSVTSPGYDENTDPLDDDGSNWYDPDNLSAGWYFTSTVTDTLSDLALANASWDHSNDAYDQLTYNPGLDGDGVFNGVSDDGDGVVTVTLTITDHVGNAASDLVVFNLDNTDPTITSPAITEGSAYLHASGLTVYYGDEMGTAPEAFTVQGNAQDSGVGLDYVAYSAALNQGYSEDSIHLENWSRDYTAKQSNTTSGVITATIYDRLGNFATQTFTYTRDINSPDISYGSPPIFEDSPYLYAPYPDGTTVYYSHQMGGTPHSFTVQGTATDNGDGAGLWRATFSSAFEVTPPADDDPANWSGTYDDVESSDNGDGTITVKVYDNVSNWSEKTFNYIEDTTNPTVTLTYVTPGGYDEDDPDDWLDADGSNWYNAGDFTAGVEESGWEFTSDTDDDGAGLASGTAAWDHSNDDFDRPIRDCGPDGDGIFPNASGDGEGTVTVTVTIADHVGNLASDTVVFNIDNTEPTITSPYISEDSDYLYRADDLITVYYGNMALAPFTVHGSSEDNTGVGLDRAEFSDAFGAAPSDDDTPDDWAGIYYPNNSQNWGSGTIYVTVYDLLGNAASQTFYYYRDITPPTVDVTCPPVSPDPSWSVSWNSSSDPPPNASGLKHFDVQYKVEESGSWQDWHTDTLLTQDTFGPISPIPVQDNTTYYFRVRAEDNVSNESSYTNGEDETTYQSGVKKVFLPILVAPDPNWGFETGDFTSWQHGGQLAQSVSTATSHSGSYSALLGNPSYPCTNVPVGSAWLSRSVTVPSSGSPTLSFYYRVFTQDKTVPEHYDKLDLFAVYINGSQLVVEHANITDPPTCAKIYDLCPDWCRVSFSLDAYKGQTIEITFYNYNRADPPFNYPERFNTYTYIDDVSIQ